MPGSDFSALPLSPSALAGLQAIGFEQMLPVQAQTLPEILAGHDVLARADTGSGKTVAFGLGMLAVLEPRLDVQALALCPTRELAEQVSAELRRLACRTPNVKVLALCGGVPFAPQRASLAQGAHVVVGTPGRVEEHLRKGSLALAHLKVVVLDEADRMLDMGFAPQIQSVLQHAPAERQTLLFSATYPPQIAELSAAHQRQARQIDVAPAPFSLGSPALPGAAAQEPASLVQHVFFQAASREREAALARWLADARPASSLVFCNTRLECDRLSAELRGRGWVAASIHGELSQRERQHVQRLFANGSCSVLVATDLAARGWDIPELEAVVHFGLPRDPTVHLHRSGRVGRVGRAGTVVSLVSEDDALALAALERAQGRAPTFSALPESEAPLPPPAPPRVTLLLNAGKNKKLRPGDILGALTAEGGLEGDAVGAIQIDESSAYVAVAAESAERALALFGERQVKGRSIRARLARLELRPEGPPDVGRGRATTSSTRAPERAKRRG